MGATLVPTACREGLRSCAAPRWSLASSTGGASGDRLDRWRPDFEPAEPVRRPTVTARASLEIPDEWRALAPLRDRTSQSGCSTLPARGGRCICSFFSTSCPPGGLRWSAWRAASSRRGGTDPPTEAVRPRRERTGRPRRCARQGVLWAESFSVRLLLLVEAARATTSEPEGTAVDVEARSIRSPASVGRVHRARCGRCLLGPSALSSSWWGSMSHGARGAGAPTEERRVAGIDRQL